MSNSSRLFFLCISLCLPFMMSCLKQASNTLQSSSAQVNIEIPYDKLQGKLTYYRLQVSSNNGEDCEVADTTSDSGGYVASNELLVRCFPYIFTLTLWKDNETDPEKYWYTGSKTVTQQEAQNSIDSGTGLNVAIYLTLNKSYSSSGDVSQLSTPGTEDYSSSYDSSSYGSTGSGSGVAWLSDSCSYVKTDSYGNYHYKCNSSSWFKSGYVYCNAVNKSCGDRSATSISQSNLLIQGGSSNSSWNVCYYTGSGSTWYSCSGD